ncbi:hypothetical protein G4B88_014555, partial [Cannabis sativa]
GVKLEIEISSMNTFSHVPPGFRFHPTDEELVDYYLRKKIASKRIDLDVIKDVDLYKIEPWDLQELCKLGSEEQNEWYFFSHKDKKYPTGTRTNRATKAGFWKATGRDKAIYARHSLIGMRKTLVFYKGRAPNGQKSDWIMHEVFKKRMATVRKAGDYDSPPCWYDDQVSFMPTELESPMRSVSHHNHHHNHQAFTSSFHQNHYPNNNCKQELELHQFNMPRATLVGDPFFQLPQLESPKLPSTSTTTHAEDHQSCLMMMSNGSVFSNELQAVDQLMMMTNNASNNNNNNGSSTTDWRVLDKLVASQLGHHDEDQQLTTAAAAGAGAPVFHVPHQLVINNLLGGDGDDHLEQRLL